MSKVLIFIDWFAPGYKAGGPITSNVNIVEHLSDKLDFYVITSSFDYHATAPYKNIQENKWVDWQGAKVMYINPSCLSWKVLKKAVEEVAAMFGTSMVYIHGIIAYIRCCLRKI